MPEISVVMPLYNKENEVMRAVRSVLAQGFPDFELIVINDGSTDGGPKLARNISDPRARVVDQPNKGVSAARNRGIGEASSELIAFLDADDEWEPDFLETIQRLRVRYPSCAVFATSYFIRTPGLCRKAVLRGLPSGFGEGILRDYFGVASISNPPICSSAVAAAKTALKAVGGFPEGIISGEDLLTWARLAAAYDVAYCTEPKAHFWEPASLSFRPGRRPQEPDIVSEGLLQIHKTYGSASKVKSLRRYISLWHRMRGMIFFSSGDRIKAGKEFSKALAFSRSSRLYSLLILSALPDFLSYGLFGSLRNIYMKLNNILKTSV